jgi:hypothetical protein
MTYEPLPLDVAEWMGIEDNHLRGRLPAPVEYLPQVRDRLQASTGARESRWTMLARWAVPLVEAGRNRARMRVPVH